MVTSDHISLAIAFTIAGM